MTAKVESWGSRVGLILAMAGNAVGLGNFLRFPVQAVQNGGGAFIVPYLVCFLLMGIPLLFVEWSMGRFGGKFGHHSTPFILDSMDKRKFWKYIGVFGIFTNLAVAAYYCYLESWTLSWVWHSVSRTFAGQSQDEVAGFFNSYVGLDMPFETIFFWILCLLLNTWILSKGLSGGVEKVAKIGMPLLILFGVFLAVMAFNVEAGVDGAIHDASVGLNFLWTPDFSTIWSPKVWLAAAGQIFFTLSVGMGSIQCYASYVKKNEDIALNAMSAGWMNEFVEVVLGAAIIIPISVGYLGIDKVLEMTQTGGLGLGFKTLPFLFEQWGTVLAIISGVFWFGLLFFAGITSSLAMGTPVMGFLKDEFGWGHKNSAWAFGGLVFILGLPTVLFFNYGVFDEYDYWAGTFSLVVFAFLEIILFSWIFGLSDVYNDWKNSDDVLPFKAMNRLPAWKEITTGADIKVPSIYKFIIKFVTPIFLGVVFFSSLPGVWDKIINKDIYEKIANTTDAAQLEVLNDTILFVNASRLLLLGVFLGISYLVFVAYKKRKREGRI